MQAPVFDDAVMGLLGIGGQSLPQEENPNSKEGERATTNPRNGYSHEQEIAEEMRMLQEEEEKMLSEMTTATEEELGNADADLFGNGNGDQSEATVEVGKTSLLGKEIDAARLKNNYVFGCRNYIPFCNVGVTQMMDDFVSTRSNGEKQNAPMQMCQEFLDTFPGKIQYWKSERYGVPKSEFLDTLFSRLDEPKTIKQLLRPVLTTALHRVGRKRKRTTEDSNANDDLEDKLTGSQIQAIPLSKRGFFFLLGTKRDHHNNAYATEKLREFFRKKLGAGKIVEDQTKSSTVREFLLSHPEISFWYPENAVAKSDFAERVYNRIKAVPAPSGLDKARTAFNAALNFVREERSKNDEIRRLTRIKEADAEKNKPDLVGSEHDRLRERIRDCNSLRSFLATYEFLPFNRCLLKLQHHHVEKDMEQTSKEWAMALANNEEWAVMLQQDLDTVRLFLRQLYECTTVQKSLKIQDIMGFTEWRIHRMFKLSLVMDRAAALYFVVDESNTKGTHWFANRNDHRETLSERGYSVLYPTMDACYLWFLESPELEGLQLSKDRDLVRWTRPCPKVTEDLYHELAIKPFDVFLVHTGAQKRDLEHVYHDFCSHGLTAFLDRNTFKPCQTPTFEISKALETCRYTIAVVSSAFLERPHCVNELIYCYRRSQWIQQLPDHERWDPLWVILYDLPLDEFKIRVESENGLAPLLNIWCKENFVVWDSKQTNSSWSDCFCRLRNIVERHDNEKSAVSKWLAFLQSKEKPGSPHDFPSASGVYE